MPGSATNAHNIKALVSGEEFWAQIMIGCGGLAAHSCLGAWRRKTTSDGKHTQTYPESTGSTHIDHREDEEKRKSRGEIDRRMGWERAM